MQITCNDTSNALHALYTSLLHYTGWKRQRQHRHSDLCQRGPQRLLPVLPGPVPQHLGGCDRAARQRQHLGRQCGPGPSPGAADSNPGRLLFRRRGPVPYDPVVSCLDRLVGLVVKASASRAEDPGFESRLRRDFFGVESYQ